MTLSKLVIKNFFYNFILNNHVFAVYFRKNNNGIIGVIVLTSLITINEKMF